MSNYARGARLERLARQALERDGYTVIRAAGSKGPVDPLGTPGATSAGHRSCRRTGGRRCGRQGVVAWNGDRFRLVQVKAKGAARLITHQQLSALPRPANTAVELWERHQAAGRKAKDRQAQWRITSL